MNQELQDYIKQFKELGMSDEQIRQELLKTGWDKEIVNKLLSEQKITDQTNQKPPQDFSPKWLLIILGILIIAGGGFFVYWKIIKPQPEPLITILPEALAQRFAVYEEVPVSITPQVPAYTVDKNLDNVINKEDFKYLPEAAKELLAENGFVVVPSQYKEFFSLYERNRYGFTPSFITTDSMLHNYHLAFDYLLRTL
ncbi:unnamed protein product, partial [marine sediment metagenome]